MPFLIIVILALISFFSVRMRAYMAFNCSVIGIGGIIAGLIADERLILFLGVGAFAIALVMLYLTSLKRAEASARKHYMLYMWVYGMFIFIKVIIIGFIITIPLLSMVDAATRNYRSVVLVDSSGNRIRNAVIDEYGNDAYGNHYDKYDPY